MLKLQHFHLRWFPLVLLYVTIAKPLCSVSEKSAGLIGQRLHFCKVLHISAKLIGIKLNVYRVTVIQRMPTLELKLSCIKFKTALIKFF